VSALSSSPWASGFQLNPSSLRMICSSLKSLRSLCQTKRESSGNLKSQLGGCFGAVQMHFFPALRQAAVNRRRGVRTPIGTLRY
jgi:hypothetical protein